MVEQTRRDRGPVTGPPLDVPVRVFLISFHDARRHVRRGDELSGCATLGERASPASPMADCG
jgi:hypothetical protein